MTSSKLYPVLYILLCTLLSDSASAEVYYVRAATSSSCLYGDPCLTLNEYVSSTTRYFTSDTTFILSEGEHHLYTTLNLDNVKNITVKGTQSNTTVILSSEGSFVFFQMSNITLSSLNIFSYGQMSSSSALLFESSSFVQLINIVFTGVISDSKFSRALEFYHSNGHIYRCSFSSRHALFGGAIDMIFSRLTFSYVNFTHNSVQLSGGAIFARSSSLQFSGENYFSHNQNTIGSGGAVFLRNSNLSSEGILTFENNTVRDIGGAVCAEDSEVKFTGSVRFISNQAEYGGGIALIGNCEENCNCESVLVLLSPVAVLFYCNEAQKGGAILVDDSGCTYRDLCQNVTKVMTCFFKIEVADTTSLDDVHINFTHNSADLGGAAIFGGALELCRVRINTMTYPGYQIFENISSVILSEEQNSAITSEALKVCHHDNKTIDCSKRSMDITGVIPGRLFSVPVVTVGQFDMPVVPNNILCADCYELHIQITVVFPVLTMAWTNLYLRVFDIDDSQIVITLIPEYCSEMPLHVHLHINSCPHGFELINGVCDCDAELEDQINGVTCDINTGLILRPANYWIRPILGANETYNGFMWHSNCPNDYCVPENASDAIMLNFTTTNTDVQCTEHRSGILCGACKEGYSLTLTDFQCTICTNKHISLILIFGLAGMALIAILLVLQMTVASGTINGLILYANIIDVYKNIFFPPDKKIVGPLNIFIAWVNLDLGIPTCFYDGLDSYSYAWLDYLFPLYLWFLIGAIIIGCKLSSRLGRLFGSNPVAVLATVILMSYTRLLQTTVTALTFTDLYFSNGTSKRVWHFDGNIGYFEGKHAILALVGILVIILLLLPYIFLLTFGYRLQAYSSKRAFLWLNKLKPLFDAYYAPYKKKTRFWTGLMLIVRVFLFIFLSANKATANVIALVSVFTAIAVFSWLIGGIYKNFYLNTLQASFVVNIVLLSTVHIALENDRQLIATHVSVGMALTEFLGIVIFHAFLRIKKFKFFGEWSCLKRKIHNLKELKTKSSQEEMSATSASTCTVELRESLLESTGYKAAT